MIITGNAEAVASAYVSARMEIQTLLVKDGKANRSTYPTLANILASITPTLIKHGLVIMQESTSNEFGVGVSTTLLHVSGSSIDFAPLTMQPADLKPQTVGSTLSYARRYSLISALGLVGGQEDDDGEKGQNGSQPVAKVANGYQDDELWEPRETVKAADPLSKAQLGRIKELGVLAYGEAEFLATEAKALAQKFSDNKIALVSKLNSQQAQAVITELEKKEKVTA